MTVVYADTITQADGSRIIKFAMEVSDVGGELRCNCVRGKNKTWCDHAQKVVVEALDKNSLPIDKGDEPTSTHATVPVQPNKGFYVNVRLTPLGKSGMVLVTHQYADMRDPFGEDAHTVELGVLQAGSEARGAIRTWVLTWMRSLDQDELWCRSSVHTRSAFSKAFPGIRGGEDYVDAYSILKTGNCSLCSEYSNFDDDVPEI